MVGTVYAVQVIRQLDVYPRSSLFPSTVEVEWQTYGAWLCAGAGGVRCGLAYLPCHTLPTPPTFLTHTHTPFTHLTPAPRSLSVAAAVRAWGRFWAPAAAPSNDNFASRATMSVATASGQVCCCVPTRRTSPQYLCSAPEAVRRRLRAAWCGH